MDNKDYIERYINNFLNNNQNDLFMLKEIYDNMTSLKKNSELFKYYSLDDKFTLKNIIDNVIHFSNPVNFNDPFDSIMGISIDNIVRHYIKDSIMPLINNKINDKETLKVIDGLFEEQDDVNFIDEMEKEGIISDLVAGKEVSKEKALSFLNSIKITNPEFYNKIINNELIDKDLNEFYKTVGQSKYGRNLIDDELKKNNYNLNLFSSNDIISQLEKIAKMQKLDFDFVGLKENIQSEKDRMFSLLKETLSNKIRMTCFTNKNDNILMWSHYANKHNGICVKYDLKDCKELLYSTFPVVYSTKRPSISKNELLISSSETKVNEDKLLLLLVKSLLTKSDEWKYEEEWRSIIPTENLISDNLKHKCIKAIYFGVKVEYSKISEIIDKLKEDIDIRNIKFFKMNMDDSTYSIKEEEIKI